MKKTTISDLMIKDHVKLVRLLEHMKEVPSNNVEQMLDRFNTFKWELERHFTTEEKVIFVCYEPQDELDKNIIPDILKQHDTILKNLKSLENDLKSNKTTNITEFERILMKHKDYEDDVLYPKFDREMDITTKNLISNNMEQPI